MDYKELNLRELTNLENKKKIEYDELLNECLKEGLTFTDFKKKATSIKEEIYFIDKYRRLKMEPTLQFEKKWRGKKLSLKDFSKKAHNGTVTDFDGTGYYATAEGVSDIEVIPSDILENLYRTDFPYVQWIRKEETLDGGIKNFNEIQA